MNENSVAGKHISRKWMAWSIVVLILVAAVSWYFSGDNGELQEGTVVIKAGDTVLGRVAIADLEKLPAADKKMVITTICGGNCKNSGSQEASSSEHLYTGTPLLEVLKSIDPDLTKKYQKVITRGIDYYSQVIDMSEVQQTDNVYLVYRDNGKPIKAKTGEEDSLMLIVSSDKSGQRFTNWLVSLDLQ